MAYQGPERRIHKVFVTTNTEYHLRRTRVVAVRDLRTGQWKSDHESLGSNLVASLRNAGNGGFKVNVGADADLGARLCFDVDVVTSPLLAIERPPREIVNQYAA